MTQQILVVEDSRTQAERLRLLLSREGYEVEVALTGREGLLKVETRRPDLVVSDVTMPEMDGFEFCRALKSSAATNRVPVILLTARPSVADIIKGLESGADNFIPKPYDDEGLLERIRRIFEQLGHRSHGRPEMEVNVTVDGKKVMVSADRQQIMELLFSTFEEVTRKHDELARAHRELHVVRAAANHTKGQFISRLSYELRTSLSAIVGLGQVLEMAPLGPQEHESVSLMIAAAHHLLGLIDDVLDMDRVEAGELALSMEPVRTADVLQEAVGLVEPLAAQRGVVVSGDVVACDLLVMADRQRLKQVVLNLLSNAVNYNRPGGTVAFCCRQRNDRRHRIQVADTGPGIAPEHLDRLFVPFDRLDAEQGSAVEGRGLGLALSKGLVEAMGGTLGVESEVGSGTTFWVELPTAQDRGGYAGGGGSGNQSP